MSNKNNRIKKLKNILLVLLIIISSSFIVLAQDLDNDGYNNTIDCDDDNNLTYMNMTGYQDTDEDNYTIGPIQILCTGGSLPLGFMQNQNGEDCDDTNVSIYLTLTGYLDLDEDNYTFGNSIDVCTDGSLPSGFVQNQNGEDCDDDDNLINPGISEILYNSVDDDCNINTKDELELTISLSKTNYNLGETVEYVLLGTPNSSISISLTSPNNYYNYNANYVNQKFPIIDTLSATNKIGDYIINGIISKDGFDEEKNISFKIINSITENVDGDTSILENETLSLSATASGGIGPYIYSWNLDDGNSKTGSSITHTYSQGGTYDVTLTIIDSEGNIKTRPIEIKIKKIHDVTFVVKDKNTNQPISGATITSIAGDTLTGNTGIQSLKMPQDTYDVHIFKEGYEMYSFNKRINEDQTIDINLKKLDETAPKITLNNKEIQTSENDTSIEYFVDDESEVSCSLYINEDNTEWWNEKNKTGNIKNNEKQIFTIANIDEEQINFKIECIDSNDNSGFSEIGTIVFNKENQDKILEYEELLNEINYVLENINNLDFKTKKLYESLEVEENLRISKKYLSSYSRDIYNIINNECIGYTCDNSKEEIDRKIAIIDNRVEESINNTIINIKIIDNVEEIRYPNEEKISEIIKKYFEYKNKSLTSKELNRLVKKNVELQSKQKISPEFYNTKINYLDKTIENSAIIIKEIDINSTSSNQLVIEYIPDMDIDEIEVIGEHKILNDNLISFDKKMKK